MVGANLFATYWNAHLKIRIHRCKLRNLSYQAIAAKEAPTVYTLLLHGKIPLLYHSKHIPPSGMQPKSRSHGPHKTLLRQSPLLAI